MVQLTEVTDESVRRSNVGQEDEEAWENDSEALSDDLSDDEDEDDDDVSERGLAVRKETLAQRIAALKDIVPPSTRRSLALRFQTASTYASFGGKVVGNLGWMVITTAILVGLPYTLASEGEAMIVQQEREYAQQQNGAQQMLGGGAPGGLDGQGQQQQGGIRPPGF
ncbi:mitochondrial import translocase, subunit Tom22 [Microstroma glucosiphilum]|uniref:Mitochondrial import translocase, subunit Tom22 n=1 Tax=Pseudomicrostroma glucosiphilum TaxID=1684307 RepID=A0A316U3D7_9BASI|nr:mitochondrial import translocase, subunit Tom22 [Pseudomicrostroma glucosiphilum]PWN19767.1 mitochondrial import translocase, subunit Tom22 [Pseudomicrostroma glucosiphilum]